MHQNRNYNSILQHITFISFPVNANVINYYTEQ